MECPLASFESDESKSLFWEEFSALRPWLVIVVSRPCADTESPNPRLRCVSAAKIVEHNSAKQKPVFPLVLQTCLFSYQHRSADFFG